MEAEEKAEEAEREAEVYSQAVSDLEQKVFQSEAAYTEAVVESDDAAAKEQRESINKLRELLMENYAKADEKGEAVVVFEREAFRERDTAARLKSELEKRTS